MCLAEQLHWLSGLSSYFRLETIPKSAQIHHYNNTVVHSSDLTYWGIKPNFKSQPLLHVWTTVRQFRSLFSPLNCTIMAGLEGK